MFDIGFGELLVCAIVALLVLGPERLPGAVRTVGRWVGRIRYSVNQFSEQIEREVNADELRRRIEEEMKRAGVDDLRSEVSKALHAPLQVNTPPPAGADAVAATPTIAPPDLVQPAVTAAATATAATTPAPPAEGPAATATPTAPAATDNLPRP